MAIPLSDPMCPQEQDYEDAKRVAEQLDIPLLRVDFIKEYWDSVFLYFLDEYKKVGPQIPIFL